MMVKSNTGPLRPLSATWTQRPGSPPAGERPGPGIDDALDEGPETDLFHPGAWQPNLVRTIERQVAYWDVAGLDLFRAMLDQARAHRGPGGRPATEPSPSAPPSPRSWTISA